MGVGWPWRMGLIAYFFVLIILVFHTDWLFLYRKLHAVVVVCRRRHLSRGVQLSVRYWKAKGEK